MDRNRTFVIENIKSIEREKSTVAEKENFAKGKEKMIKSMTRWKCVGCFEVFLKYEI